MARNICGGFPYDDFCYDPAAAGRFDPDRHRAVPVRQEPSGTIGGIADSYMAKSKAKSLDAKLAKATKWVGAAFIVLTLVINCMLAAGL